MGLLGSSHYVKHPPWPIEKSYAMINMDMIGRLENNRVYVLGADSAKEFRPLVGKIANGFKLQKGLLGSGLSIDLFWRGATKVGQATFILNEGNWSY